jgi:hypothetical protein
MSPAFTEEELIAPSPYYFLSIKEGHITWIMEMM